MPTIDTGKIGHLKTKSSPLKATASQTWRHWPKLPFQGEISIPEGVANGQTSTVQHSTALLAAAGFQISTLDEEAPSTRDNPESSHHLGVPTYLETVLEPWYLQAYGRTAVVT